MAWGWQVGEGGGEDGEDIKNRNEEGKSKKEEEVGGEKKSDLKKMKRRMKRCGKGRGEEEKEVEVENDQTVYCSV